MAEGAQVGGIKPAVGCLLHGLDMVRISGRLIATGGAARWMAGQECRPDTLPIPVIAALAGGTAGEVGRLGTSGATLAGGDQGAAFAGTGRGKWHGSPQHAHVDTDQSAADIDRPGRLDIALKATDHDLVPFSGDAGIRGR